MIVATFGASRGRHDRRHEPDSEVGPEDRIRLDELLRDLDQPDESSEQHSR